MAYRSLTGARRFAALAASAGLLFRSLDQIRYRPDGRHVVTLRRRHAFAQQHLTIVAQRDDFDLAAAEIDANAH